MSNQEKTETYDREEVFQAIRDSWCEETCGDPANWSPQRPSWQQCDASSFVAWEHLGGDLVLGKVFLDGEESEHHYWNRIDGHDFDLTQAQFTNGEELREVDVLTSTFLSENTASMKPEVLERIAIMRQKVSKILGT